MKQSLGKNMSIVLITMFAPFWVHAQSKEAPIELTLDRAIEIALNENPSVKVADLEIQKKKYAKSSAQSSLYPQIDAVGQYSRTLKKQMNSSILTVIPDEKVDALLEKLRALDKETERQGLHAFVWNIEQMV